MHSTTVGNYYVGKNMTMKCNLSFLILMCIIFCRGANQAYNSYSYSASQESLAALMA